MKSTNYQMLNKLSSWYPETRGIISGSEVGLIKSTLCLDEMNELELRNLRDFVVIFLNREEKKYDDTTNDGFRMIMKIDDKISAIVAVIDEVLFNNGASV